MDIYNLTLTTVAKSRSEMANYTEEYDSRIGPCSGLSWGQWCDIQCSIADEMDEEQKKVIAEEAIANLEKENFGENNTAKEAEDDFDCPPTPKASHSSIRRQLFKSHAGDQKKSPNLAFNTPTSTPVKIACPDAPKKAKTRAQRRAIDNDSVQENPFETPKKKERRTDYWVYQDSLRMNRARALKSFRKEQTVCSDEEDIFLNTREFVFEKCYACQCGTPW